MAAPVITVTRQYASGGSDVAHRVAVALGWTVIDNEFVDQVAERAGLPAAEVAQREERAPGLLERLGPPPPPPPPPRFPPPAPGARGGPGAGTVGPGARRGGGPGPPPPPPPPRPPR